MICILPRRSRSSRDAELGDVDAVVEDLSGGGLDEAEDRAAGRGFAAAGFADEAERLAAVDVEADVVDGADVVDRAGEDAAADGEIDLQVFYGEERRGAFGDGLRVGGVVAFFPGVADPGEFGFGMQEPAAACGFEMLEALGVHFLFDDAEFAVSHFASFTVFHEVVDGRQAAVFGFEPRAAGEEAFGVRVLGVGEDFEHGAVLDFFAAVHHEHVVGDFGDDAEVVRDEDDGHAAVVAQLAEDFEDLGLDGDVEGGGRFVGDEQLRVAGEGHRDHDALLLAAGHLVRVGIDALLGFGDADFAEQLDRFAAGFGFADSLVEDDRFHDLSADGEHRVQRRHRLLKDHADVAAADRLHLPLGQADQIAAEERDFARFDAGGRGEEPHDRERRDAFAGTAFADDAERAALLEFEREIVDGFDDAFFGVEEGAEVVDFEEGWHKCVSRWSLVGGLAEAGVGGFLQAFAD